MGKPAFVTGLEGVERSVTIQSRVAVSQISGHRRVAGQGKRIVIAGLALLVLGLLAWPWLRGLVGLAPKRVLLVYVREENSLGLEGIPSENEAQRVGLVVAGDVAILPVNMGRIPSGTRVMVLRETFVAGLLVESRAVFLKRLPGLVVGRANGEGAAGTGSAGSGIASCALLAANLQILPAGSGGGGAGAIAFSVSVPGGGEAVRQTVLAPGQEWRLGAIAQEGGGVGILDPGNPGYASALRQAFHDGRPVSVLSVVDLGYWDTDRIEPGRDSEGY